MKTHGKESKMPTDVMEEQEIGRVSVGETAWKRSVMREQLR